MSRSSATSARSICSRLFPLQFEDVAASINPATVHFRSLTEPAKLNVVEQNYEYDLLDPQKLLQKYVGREVTFVRAEKDAGSTNGSKRRRCFSPTTTGQSGKSAMKSSPACRCGFLPLSRSCRTIFTAVPRSCGRSTIAAPKRKRVEASYLTSNMNWSADYVLTVGRDEKTADLDGWVTLVNNSGVAYDNAKLQLVAGQIQSSRPACPVQRKR